MKERNKGNKERKKKENNKKERNKQRRGVSQPDPFSRQGDTDDTYQ